MKYFRGLTPALIGLTALWLTGCAVSRTATKESVESRVAEERITEARDSVVLEFRDTLKEVTTVTVLLRQAQDPLDPPDTVKVSTVTDRTRARSMSDVRWHMEEVRVVRDTVYVERRDSTSVKESAGSLSGSGTARASPVVQALKWAFWLVVAVGVVIFGLKFFGLFHF